jgi:hypothetical protein
LIEIPSKRNQLLALWFLAAGFAQAADTRTDVPFEAVYEVTINGKPRIETRVSLAENGGQWKFESRSKGTRGLTRLLGADSHETSTGQFQDGRFIPSEFQHRSKLAGRDDIWTAGFDWTGMQVNLSHAEGDSVLPVNAGTTDPMSMTLAIRKLLGQGLRNFTMEVVNEDEIKRYEYQAGEAENLDTPLGCLETIPLIRVRKAGSKRFSSSWYAGSLAWLPVRIRHGKQGGKVFEMRISHLVMDGKEVSGPSACPS